MLLTADPDFVNPRRGWATLTSFALQTMALAAILVIPLVRPSLLPQLSASPPLVPLVAPSHFVPIMLHPSPSGPMAPHATVSTVPRLIFEYLRRDSDPSTSAPEEAPCISCIGPPSHEPGIPGIDVGGTQALPPPPPVVTKPPRISRMMDGMLLYRVQPEYPAMAKQIRLQGTVQIAALISKEGTIENLHVLSGPPMLIPSAMSAVKQWRYRPYVLNGDPIEVETQITVNFSLGGN